MVIPPWMQFMTFMDAMNIMNSTNTIKYLQILQLVKDLMDYNYNGQFHPWTPSHGVSPWISMGQTSIPQWTPSPRSGRPVNSGAIGFLGSWRSPRGDFHGDFMEISWPNADET